MFDAFDQLSSYARVKESNEASANGPAVTKSDAALSADIVHSEDDEGWWIPSGRIFFSANAETVAEELKLAQQHFFMPQRFLDPFASSTTVSYDLRDLLPTETRDALGNVMRSENDYRVMQTHLVTDMNLNRAAAAFDALGMVVGTAVMGKENDKLGVSLDEFDPDLDDATIRGHLQDPFADHPRILKRASTRIVYDPHLYQRTQATLNPQPNIVYTLARETHDADLSPAK